jgi:serine/threonine protein kinase
VTQTTGGEGPTAPVVAGYRVEELVGSGGCGEVWRARDVLTGRLVALKRLHHDGPPAERDRLRREAAVLAGLSSPHIVRLLTVLTSAQGLVLVLEFQGGGSLASLLRARPRLAPGEVVTIAAPLASALAEVHATGLVHGDVSPANLLFAADGRPVRPRRGAADPGGRCLRAGGGLLRGLDRAAAVPWRRRCRCPVRCHIASAGVDRAGAWGAPSAG